MNGPDKAFSRRQEKSLLRIAAQITRSAFDSPQRIGCPKSQTLKLLAQRSPSVGESPDLIDHIATCSPCFNEYSGIGPRTSGGLQFGSGSPLSRS